MGTILFDTPRIADKPKNDSTGTRYQQKGPTCWYYAAKMLTKLHRVRDGGSIDLRALHWVRKILTELDLDAGLIGEDQTESLTRIRGRLQAERDWRQEAIDEYDRLVAFSREIPGADYPKHRVRLQTTRIKMKFGVQSVDAARTKLEEVKRALAQMKTATDMNRYSLLQKFAAGLFEKHEVATAALSTPESVEKLLRNWGPFYASGHLFSRRQNRRDIDTSLMSPAMRSDALAEVLRLENDPHAVVVTGINTASGTIYYKDPNRTDQIRVTPYSRFIANWPAGSTNCTVIVLKCPERADALKGQGGCPHTSQVIQLDTEQVILGSLWDY